VTRPRVRSSDAEHVASSDAEDAADHTTGPRCAPGWPSRLVEEASRPPAAPGAVVRGSTPVVFFGDPAVASVATLGINPSPRQFVHQNGVLRQGPDRRLATLPWLGLGSWDELDRDAGQRILAECAAYFEPGRAPYRRWFDPFDRVLVEGLGVSYYDGRACHLNLVPWATHPVWRDLDRAEWGRLAEAALPFLVGQLEVAGYRVVVVNGRTVMDEVAAAGVVEWSTDVRLPGPPAAQLCVGEAAGTFYAGWTCNLQNQPGAARLAGDLARWLRSVAEVSDRHTERLRYQPRKSTAKVSTTSSPSTTCRRSW